MPTKKEQMWAVKKLIRKYKKFKDFIATEHMDSDCPLCDIYEDEGCDNCLTVVNGKDCLNKEHPLNEFLEATWELRAAAIDRLLFWQEKLKELTKR